MKHIPNPRASKHCQVEIFKLCGRFLNRPDLRAQRDKTRTRVKEEACHRSPLSQPLIPSSLTAIVTGSGLWDLRLPARAQISEQESLSL